MVEDVTLEYEILRKVVKTSSRIITLDCRRKDFTLFGDLLVIFSWGNCSGGQMSWGQLTDLQKRSLQTTINVPCNVQEVQQVWQKVTMEEQGIPHQAYAQRNPTESWRRRNIDSIWEYRYTAGKAQAELQLEQVRDVKSSKKGCCNYTVNKRKTKENVCLLLSVAGNPVRKDVEKAEMYNILYLLWFFTGKACPVASQFLESTSRMCDVA